MSLTAGTQLGPYEIVAPIGAGGMGEVYKARDTRLDRVVALKVSKENFSERFDREARAVAALNHPHICTLHDIGPNYLVMEYIEGGPLKGPLPLSQAVKYAVQICDALDAAHKKKIVHRDLKPGNLLVTKAGVKILDFGLAKMGSAVRVDEATLTNALTGKGEILGTLNYMSPEQLQGREAGPPSDIFSLGLVLYEMLTGRRAFDGSSPASVIAVILERPSPSIAEVASPALDRVLHRCLEKDPDNRWQSARDLKAELEWITTAPEPLAKSAPSHSRFGKFLGWIVAAAIAIGLAVTLSAPWRPTPETTPITFELNLPEGEAVSAGYPVISPDGQLLVVIAFDANGQRRLLVRRLDSLSWQRLPGTEGAAGPTWSPDSHYIAFVAGTRLKKIDVRGGPPQPVTDFPGGWIPFTAWNRDGVILFSRRDGLWRVSASGGDPAQVTAYDASRQEDLHGVPYFLPDGRHFLYLARSVKDGQGAVYVGLLDATPDKNHTFIRSATSSALYGQSRQGAGYLLFEREGALMAQPFDADRLRLTGEPFLALAQVGLTGSAVAVSVSETGVMSWFSDSSGGQNAQLAWFDRSGKPLKNVGPPGRYADFSLSPDGKRLAVSRNEDRDLWPLDLAGTGFTRFTVDAPSDRFPVWSPDSSRIVYSRSLAYLYEKTADGTAERQLTEALGIPTDWSPDGHTILVRGNDGDLWALTDGKPTRIMQTKFNERQGQFSPDGKWIAFVSDESNRTEVYVQPFPTPGEKSPISTGGGVQPRWRRDGKELFYVALDNKLMAVSVKTAAGFSRDAPMPLFDLQITDAGGVAFDYLVDGDAPRFLIRTPAKGAKPFPIMLSTNWLAAVKK